MSTATAANTETANKNTLSIVKHDVIDVVSSKIRNFMETGELCIPEDYSPENALKAAWLTLQETKDKNDNPALSVCTKDSVANALLSLVVQGLNTSKNQAYFIVYGDKLVLQRSYFGSILMAKRANPEIEDVIGNVVYEGDEFEYFIHRGKKYIRKHIQNLENIDKKKIVAAYATVLRKDGNETKEYSNIMTMEQLKQAWKQSKMNPITENGSIKAGSTHDKFTADMAAKTVINGTCKQIINTSTDNYLVLKAYRETEDAAVSAEANAEIAEKANQKVIDVPASEVRESEQVPVLEQQIDTDTGEILESDEPNF